MNRRQIYAWAGMIGQALFVLIFLIEGWYRPEWFDNNKNHSNLFFRYGGLRGKSF